MNKKPASNEREEENLYAPMSSQAHGHMSSADSAHKSQLTPLLVKLVGICAAFSVAYQLAAAEGDIALALESLVIGVVVGLVAALAPDAHHLGWKSKYWQGTRIFLMLVAIALLLPIELPIELFQAVIAFYVCIVSLLMVIEWVVVKIK